MITYSNTPRYAPPRYAYSRYQNKHSPTLINFFFTFLQGLWSYSGLHRACFSSTSIRYKWGYAYSFCQIFQGLYLFKGLRLFQTLEYSTQLPDRLFSLSQKKTLSDGGVLNSLGVVIPSITPKSYFNEFDTNVCDNMGIIIFDIQGMEAYTGRKHHIWAHTLTLFYSMFNSSHIASSAYQRLRSVMTFSLHILKSRTKPAGLDFY